MTEGRGLNRLIPAPNLRTLTRYPMAETWDLKMTSPPNHPVSGFPWLDGVPTANRYFTLISFTNVSCGACLLVFQPPGSAV